MTDYMIYIVIAIAVAFALWFLFAKVLKNKKPKEITRKDIPIDIEALVNALGDFNNIKESIARLLFLLKMMML